MTRTSDNGLVGPDGSPHPGLIEVAWAYRPVTVTSVRGRRVRVTNRRAFASLRDLEAHWSLLVDGAVVEEGLLEIELDGATSKVLSIPFTTELAKNQDARVHVCWRQRDTTQWAEAGHLVSWDEVVLRSVEPTAQPPRTLERSTTVTGAGSVRAGQTELRWDETAALSLIVDGVDVEIKAVAPSLFRAPTDNDGVKQGWMSDYVGLRRSWVRWGLDSLHHYLEAIERAETADGRTAVSFHRRLVGNDAQAKSVSRFIVGAEGIVLEETIEIPDEWTDLPRVGTRFEVAPRFDRLSWLGSGPHETYPDRKSSGLTGVWQSRVAEQYHPFVVPQEHGAHADTQWFTLTDRHGKGVRVSADVPVSFSARFEHDAMLAAAMTIAQVEQSDTIEVHVDAAVRGLGTAACGPDCLPEFRVGSGTYSWTTTFTAEKP